MAAPALIAIGSAAVVAASPGILSSILSIHGTNMAIQMAYLAARYTVSTSGLEELSRIADNLEYDDGSKTVGLAEVSHNNFTHEGLSGEGRKSLAEIVHDKPSDVKISINNVASPVEAPYESEWSSIT